MKVLHIINSLATGGAEKLIIDSLPLYNEVENVNASLSLLDAQDYPFYKEFKKKNKGKINVIEFSKGSIYNPFHLFKIIPILAKYDVIHVHLFPALYWVALAKFFSRSKTKLVFTEHSTNNKRISNVIFRQFDKLIYKNYSKIICISEEVKIQLSKLLSIKDSKLIVINNGINLNKIKEAQKYNRQEFGYSNTDFLLVMVAAFRTEKDHETLIRTVRELPPQYKLLLVGDGDRRTIIEEFVKNLNMADRVEFLGIRLDVFSILKMCDVAVLSSHWEGFGLAAVEAMAAGVPVIASDVKGLSEVVEGGGVLFEKGNSDALERKIIEITQNKELYNELIVAGQKKAQNYDINISVSKITNTYLCL